MADVDIVGVNRLLRAVQKFEDGATNPEIHKVLAELVHIEARRRTPVGPGRRGHRAGALKRSGRASGTKKAGFVRFGGPRAPYAGPAHFGHRPRPQGGWMAPNPFLYDALDSRRDAVFARYATHVLKTLRSSGVGS